jgi:hypothetical protein
LPQEAHRAIERYIYREENLKNTPTFPGGQGSPCEFRHVRSEHFFIFGMRTFLAGFCAPEGPLAKALGIFASKTPPPLTLWRELAT